MVDKTYALTHAQRRVWFTELLDPGTSICNLAACVKFRGEIDPEILQRALDFSFSRNVSLQLQLTEGDGPEPELYLAEHRPVSLEIIDFTNSGIDERDKWIEAQTYIPFKLFHSPLYQAFLLKISKEEVWLYAKFHHIIMDGISLNLLGNQLIDIYQKIMRDEPLPEHDGPSYLTYMEKEQQYLQSSRFEKDRLFWTEKFDSIPEHPTLTEHSPGKRQSTAASRDTITLSHSLEKSIRRFCEHHQVSILSLFMASLYILISRLTSKKDIAIGTYYGNRGSRLEKDMLGMFVSTLPVRMMTDPDSDFISFVHSVGKEQLSVMRHQKYPYNLLVNQLRHAHHDLQNLIGISMQYQPLQWKQADGFDYETALYFSGHTANELSVSIKERIDTGMIQLNFDYQTALFTQYEVKRIQTHLLTIVEKAIADPKQLIRNIDMVDSKEKDKILFTFNKTETLEPLAPTLHALFSRRAALSPHLPALRFSGGIITYGELDQYTNRLAIQLKKKGAEEGSVIGVLAERSPEMVISVLAVLKAGGAYVPLDPAYPEERLGFMLHDSGAKLLIVQPGLSVPGFSGETMEVDLAALTEETSETEPLSVDIDGGSLAYIIYTSGSTGRPKGVAVEHRQAVAFLSGMQEQFPLSEDDVIVLKSSFSFDASIWQLFWWAIPGASVYLLPPGWEKDPALMAETFTAEGVTTAHFIPAMVNSFLERLEMETEEKRTSLSNTLKRVFAGGEALAPQTAARFARLLPETALIHGYGPTEATVDAAFHVYDARKDSERTRLPIGKPVPGARLYVLDDQRAVQPVGVAGELYIAGSGVSRGYVNRPELTEERFLDDPFYPGERMYRTGDLARWLPDGHVEWLGRLDSQVKIRGYRIEPGEIEAAIRHIEGVREAAVAARTENGETGLVAYIEGQNQQTVRTELAKRLPAYMMPSHVIEMKQWPVTPSGKLDRKALPAPDGAADRGAYAPPRNMTEMKLARLWEEVLKNGPVGIRDHFFERGGHSLKATALVSRIVKEFGVQVPLKDIFARPTVEELAAVIQELDETPYAAIEPAEKQDTYPVSSAQKRMYVLQQLDEGGTGYNMPAVLELTGPLDRARLDTVFRQLIRRHESLRTSFETGADGEPVQRIHDEVPFRLMEEASAEHFVRPFRLHEAPLFRAALVKEAEERHLLLVDMHHIISDGVSVNTLIREFCELYASRTLDPMRIQYKDYAVWQQEFKKGEAYRRQEAYWLKQLDGELPVLELPADNARPAVRSFAGDTVSRTVDAKTAAGLYRIARENGCTLYMVLLAAFNTLLARLGGQEDIIVGSPIAGRPHKDLEPILGMFVNTLAIRTHPTENKRFSDFLREVRQTALEAYEHQDYPFEELVERLGVVRDMSRNPLFDAMFILQNMEQHDIRLAGLHVNRVQEIGHKVSIFDLTLSAVEESGGEIHFEMEFSTDLFLKETVERWLKHFAELLRDIAIQPETKLSRLNMLTDDDKHKILVEFNDTQINFPEKNKLFHELFEKKAEDVPGQIAVIKGQKQISYRQLNERANQLARTLQKAGISPGKKAAVLADRSIEAVICVLAVMKAGGAYIPIDSQYPEERIRFLLKDSEAAVLLQADYKELASHLAESGVSCISIHLDHEEHDDPDTENLVSTASPEDTAYVIYTSGTTGTPKGVEVRHRNFTHAALAWRNIYELDRMPARVLQMASFSFDVFSGDLARALLNGGTLVICPDDVRLEPEQLSQLINQQQITFMESTPALIVPFMEYVYRRRRSLPSLRLLILGSDVIKAQDFYTLNKRFGKELRIMNSYGVTEATIDSSYYEVQMSQELREEFVPIGIPLPNVQLYVLNNDKQVQPIGIPGELYIGGEGVAKGYWGRAELSEAKFNDPFAKGQTLYQTGDQACWLPDGTLRFCGRMDKQVKIKGYRIETGEIESVILQNSHIKEAAVAVQKDADGQSYLAAYIVPKETDFTDLRLALTKELPAYMIPAHFFGLEKMPLTVNGKLDKDALPAVHIKPSPVYHPPNSDKQAVLCRIWEDVLHIPRAGITDSFFELGGDSIKALQVSARLAAEGWNMTIRDLFQFPTIQELEHHLTPAETIPDQGAVEGHAELTPVQQRFFDDPGAFEHHYNQSVMMCSKERLDERALCQAIRSLTEHHDALRIVFTKESSGRIRQFNRGIGTKDEDIFTLRTIDLTDVTQIEQRIKAEEKAIQQAMRLDQGPLIHVGLFRLREADHLLISIHHLIVDGVSWRILLEDLQTAYQQAIENRKIELPLKSDSYLKYANKLPAIAKGHEVMEEKAYWEHVMSQTEPLPKDFRGVSDGLQINARTATCTLSERLTSRLLFETQQAYGTDANELMLTALGMALTEWTKSEQTVISIEGHGREGHVPDLDISRTVGWFTSIYPVLLNMSVPDDSSEKTAYRIKAVKDMMRRVPNRGTGYGLLKYSNHIRYRDPEVSFNYLGQFDGLEGMMRLSPYQPLHEIAEERPREFELDINAMIVNRQLQVKAVYTDVFSRRTIESFLDTFHDCLKGIIEHCAARKEREKTLSDFTNKELTSASLTSIANLVKEL
ncbi:non-ribosomal peptide synthetase [Bacillus glycinifermentans]|uniref:non-ribosomal peptide synthetase n=1 Tax=Bacillus glycinifermentans TaxID=1664069 RepID=UPI001FF1780B|nr:non-ribosomal peptide synthetase [Bacillus glycinifermentans]UOY89131.1 amino acid adenylation domain-containing protein [Bacillus glycinifermentans]